MAQRPFRVVRTESTGSWAETAAARMKTRSTWSTRKECFDPLLHFVFFVFRSFGFDLLPAAAAIVGQEGHHAAYQQCDHDDGADEFEQYGHADYLVSAAASVAATRAE